VPALVVETNEVNDGDPEFEEVIAVWDGPLPLKRLEGALRSFPGGGLGMVW
jgi:hypothetical protein